MHQVRKKPYLVDVSREHRWWLLYVHELDVLGQAEQGEDLVSVSRDLIALWLDVDLRSVRVRLRRRSARF